MNTVGKVDWLDKPEDHDFDAAASYLSLLAGPEPVARIVAALRKGRVSQHEVKDLLRASELPLLPKDNVHVADDLDKIGKGRKLSPILLVRGDFTAGYPLQIADGYHRVCAAYYTDENTAVPGIVVDA